MISDLPEDVRRDIQQVTGLTADEISFAAIDRVTGELVVTDRSEPRRVFVRTSAGAWIQLLRICSPTAIADQGPGVQERA